MAFQTHTGSQSQVEGGGQQQPNQRRTYEESNYQPTVTEVCHGSVSSIVENAHQKRQGQGQKQTQNGQEELHSKGSGVGAQPAICDH